MKFAQPNRDERSIEECKNMIEVSKELRKECERMDSDGSGTITMDEFSLHLNDERLRAKMDLLGLNVQDAEMFFKLLAHISDGEEVVISDFVHGCCKLRGLATRIDLQTLSVESKKAYHQQRRFERKLAEQFDGVQKLLERLVPQRIAE
eukprot:CAMPEP_0180528326 /NCGR_PEP_ID=MMETSP1036_2-20121128/60728_1 /TAXON_ID=632150 /ORGANISM="Azadinium spinosum, Strain 3D9" /LENGTH=148 /DNA_ID=CAMNT_0022541857 /DNA_START=26 /DNA_END=472 /DNA_ORIENTATION=+